jgi:Type IV secretory system Conjugative DNA transfer/AAA-like domain
VISPIGFAAISLFVICALVILALAFFGFSQFDQLQGQTNSAVLMFTLNQLWIVTQNAFISVIGGGFSGLGIACYLNYYLIPQWERGEGLHDVNQIVKTFTKLNGYNPMPYIDIQKGCFIGLGADKKAIYVAWKKIRETHIQVIGTTGCGKGVLMTLVAYQSILVGESLVWIDPKYDRFSPRILAVAAKQATKSFYLINLNPDQPPQLNPFAGAEAHEIEELLVSAFDLKGKGTDGDFHRGKDEDAAIEASRLAVEKDALSLPELIEVCRSVESITDQENFWRKLGKLGDLNAIKTKGGINLKDAILNGSVIYIVGSTDNERVKMLQKLLLVRINQIIKKQDRFKKHKPTCIVLDEFKHILSPTALTGLGVIRDYDAHCLLAHQSLGDLDSCAGITRAEAEGAVLDNTAIKIVYRIGDSSYAEKLSKNSGKRVIFAEQSGKNLDENNNSEGGWRETHVPLIDPDVLTHLPMPSDRKGQASVGVVFGVGIAKLFHVGHIAVAGNLPPVKIAPLFESKQANNAGDLI